MAVPEDYVDQTVNEQNLHARPSDLHMFKFWDWYVKDLLLPPQPQSRGSHSGGEQIAGKRQNLSQSLLQQVLIYHNATKFRWFFVGAVWKKIRTYSSKSPRKTTNLANSFNCLQRFTKITSNFQKNQHFHDILSFGRCKRVQNVYFSENAAK